MTEQMSNIIESLVRDIEDLESRIDREDGYGTSLYMLVKELESKKKALKMAQNIQKSSQ